MSNQPLNRANVTSRLFRFGAKMTDTLNHGSADPAGLAGVSSYGLQRITNLLPGVVQLSPGAFVSPDDPVTQTEGAMTAPLPSAYAASIAATQGASPLVPDLSTGSVQNDFAYSYMFTGQQSNANEYTVFDGSVVVHNNRPFGLDPTGAAGERVVEGIFAYGINSGPSNGYSTGNPRLVLLRWPDSEPDPEVAPGSWIADVTYEQNATNSAAKAANTPPYPMQRCYWYRVAKRSTPNTDPDVAGFRSMQVTLATPVRAKTLLGPSTDTPVFTNVALLCPSVVNVFPKVIYTRD